MGALDGEIFSQTQEGEEDKRLKADLSPRTSQK